MNYRNEQWNEITFEGQDETRSFKISNYGRIKYKRPGKNYVFVKTRIDKTGYSTVDLGIAVAKRKSCYVHKLVAIAFLEKDHEMQEFVIHRDYNKSNNHVSNLTWVTRKTMHEHHKLNPAYNVVKGNKNNAKLTETEVMRIKLKLRRGKGKLYKIAEEFGITHTQLNRIRSGENWGHVKV